MIITRLIKYNSFFVKHHFFILLKNLYNVEFHTVKKSVSQTNAIIRKKYLMKKNYS